MVVSGDRHGSSISGQSTSDQSSRSAPESRKPWVTPAWERLDTPMEITMYAARRQG